MIDFKVTPDEFRLIRKIVDRAGELWKSHGVELDRMTLDMDVTACHKNGCQLDLAGMLVMPDEDFVHDIAGIMRHIDRKTGQLLDCFVPRCALSEVAPE